MKSIFTLLLAALAFAATAQPQKIHYQGVAVGANGKPIKNNTVGLRLSVLDSLPTGTALYTETQTASTDGAGQFSIFLGGGTATAGSFANLPWANGNDKFLKVEMDAQGGTNYQPMGTTQLVSVPYAMAAGSLREGTLLYGNNGMKFQITIDSAGPKWICYPPISIATAGPDQLNLIGNTVALSANTPATGETGAWSILSGNGGNLSSINNPTATFTKGTDSAYTMVWTMTGLCGTSRDTVNLRFPAPVGTACGQAVTYAGESYPTVQIGTQCWFAKNLNVGTMINSASAVDSQRNNGVLEKYCYNNDSNNCTTYGGLYQWAEAVQYQNGASNTTSSSLANTTGNVQGICPTGWHLPRKAEYCTLSTYLDSTSSICSASGFGATSSFAGGLLKSTIGLWTSPNTGATNSSGFSALPGGKRMPNGTFSQLRSHSYFLSSTEYSATTAIDRGLFYSNSNFQIWDNNKINGFSARCIQD